MAGARRDDSDKRAGGEVGGEKRREPSGMEQGEREKMQRSGE